MSETEASALPSDIVNTAICALQDAERRLRDAAAKAATAGAYDSVVIISRWAKALQTLLAEGCSSTSNGSIGEERVNLDASSSSSSPFLGRSEHKPQPKRRARRGATFRRDADFLVKCARSRRTRIEYEHRAPKEVIFGLAESLADWRPTRKLLTTEQLVQAYVKRKGTAVSYQVYVVLGWLTNIGLVRRHGRSGYSIPCPKTICDDVQNAWKKLENEAP